MPKSYRLTMQREGYEDIEIRGEFSDDEHTVLSAYLHQYEELVQSKPIREGIPCSIEVQVEATKKELRVTTRLPTNDDLAILLHRLRPFILEDEPASFAKVSAILGRHINDPHVRGLLRQQHRLYDGRDMQQQIKILSNEVVVNSERVLRDWLNSSEYHRDRDKRRAVESLLQRMPDDLLRGILVSLLVDKIKAIQGLASLTGVTLGRHQEFTFSGTATS